MFELTLSRSAKAATLKVQKGVRISLKKIKKKLDVSVTHFKRDSSSRLASDERSEVVIDCRDSFWSLEKHILIILKKPTHPYTHIHTKE